MDYHIIGGDGKVYGPKPESEVRDWIREGRLNAESRICRAGGEDWLTLDRLPESCSRLPRLAADRRPHTLASFGLKPLPEPHVWTVHGASAEPDPEAL